MGLFDKILGAKEAEKTTLNKEEAFAAIPLATIAADGNISEEEVLGIITALTRMKLFANHDAKKMNSMFNKLIGVIKRQGVDALVTSSKETLPPELRETVFAVSADLALADGILEKAEKDILTKIQQTLGVPEDVAIKIIEVILIKNKG
jgi:tellurite resistance protein